MKTIPIIESERLQYVPMSLNFANENYLNWLNDPEVNRYMDFSKNTTLEDLRKYIQSTIDSNIFFWAIIKKEDGKHIGNIKIDPINSKHGYGEYGILLGDKSEWGNGFAKEASQSIIKYCFNNIGLRKINLGVLAINNAAIKLYEKLNFVVEGVYKNHVVFEDTYCDVFRMALFNKSVTYSK
jgi:[ribosomal protein S5]-alanine N-acetyltransferase